MNSYYLYFVYIVNIMIAPIGMVLSLLLGLYNILFRYENVKSIAGEIAVVTGGGGGLGRALSMELAKHGCHVAIVDINHEEAEKTARCINENYKVKTKAYKVDITNYDEVVELNENIINDLGKATVLVNNAGILTLSDVFKPDPKEVQKMINVNLTSHFWTNQVFLENMKEIGRGHIVAISSIGGIRPLLLSSVYTSTKHGVRGLMRVLRIELRLDQKFKDIKTTTVYPTYLDTNSMVLDFIKNFDTNKMFIKNGAVAANRIIQGMLRNEVEIGIPDIEMPFSKIIEYWPAEIYDWITAKIILKLTSKQLISKFR